jgi:hypothetical protein
VKGVILPTVVHGCESLSLAIRKVLQRRREMSESEMFDPGWLYTVLMASTKIRRISDQEHGAYVAGTDRRSPNRTDNKERQEN